MKAIAVSNAMTPEPLYRQEINESIAPLFTGSTGVGADGAIQDPAPFNRVFDLPAALERAGGDRELLRKMAGVFAIQWRERLDEASRAAKRRDGAALQAVARQLEQSLGSFGARKASRAAQELKELGRSRNFQPAEEKAASLRVEVDRLVQALSRINTRL